MPRSDHGTCGGHDTRHARDTTTRVDAGGLCWQVRRIDRLPGRGVGDCVDRARRDQDIHDRPGVREHDRRDVRDQGRVDDTCDRDTTDRDPTDRHPTDRHPTDRHPTDRHPTDHGDADRDTAPRWLLLHGTGASIHSWRDVAPRLSAHGHVLLPDLPGHGDSQPLPRAQRSMAGMARALRSLLDACGFVPTCVVGHSAGAAVAVRLALDGDLAAGCTIVGLNAALLPFGGVAGAIYAPLARLLAVAPVVPHLAAWRARDAAGIRRLIDATGSRLDDDGVAGYARLLSKPDHVAGVLAMMANWDLDALAHDLPRLRQPLHLLVGERDRAVPPAQADVVARRVAGVRVHRLPGLGHLMHEEAPALLAERIVASGRGSG